MKPLFRPIVLLLALLLAPSSYASQGAGEAYSLAGSASGRYVGGYTLVDQDNRKFTVKELMGGKPLVVNFIYTGCSLTCSTVTSGLEKAFKKTGADFGAVFTALTVGFDAGSDRPETMKAFGGRFTKDFKAWRFASADKATVEKITKDFGFYFEKAEGGYEHFNMITVVDKDGKVFKQIYGADFDPDEVVSAIYLSMKSGRAAYDNGGAVGLIERIKLLCYTYDEATGTYKFDYTFITLLGLGFAVKSMLGFLIIYLYRSRHGRLRSRTTLTLRH